ncbi:MAG: hypothetical protein QOF24_2561 [Verrucomicrobiota bacterium]|jgi:hypothetical protein
MRSVVEDWRPRANDLNQTVNSIVEAPVEAIPPIDDLLSIQVAPPVREESPSRIHEETVPKIQPGRRNYLEIEARNRSLGRAGEDLVLRFEHERLTRIGERTLAGRIQIVSRTLGDHLGYDIVSFEADGRERLIEVKTTRFGAMTPFFASRNEVNVSAKRETQCQLYRLFSFHSQPRLFALSGSLSDSCRLVPANYSATPYLFRENRPDYLRENSIMQ